MDANSGRKICQEQRIYRRETARRPCDAAWEQGWLMYARPAVSVLATACLVGPTSTALAADEPANQRTTPTPAPVVLRTTNGFDWGDAAIGAVAGVGAAVAAAGGITLARNK